MKQITFTILLALFAMAGQAQNQDLEHLFQKYRGNPAIEFVNLMDSFPDAQHVKVAETFEFGDSLSLVRHFVEEYEQIKNFKKMKASKVIKIKGNLLMKMAMNQAFTVRLWEDENGYKDTVIEFDGCRYAVIHLGGFYKEDEIAKSEPNPITSEYGTHRFFSFAYCSTIRSSASRLLTWLSPPRSSASYSWQRLRSSSAIARIRLSSESCALSLPCGTD